MPIPAPTVIAIVPCAAIELDGNSVTLKNVVHELAFRDFPAELAALVVYVALSEGRGAYRMSADVVDDDEKLAAEVTDDTVVFDDVLHVQYREIPLRNITFERPGRFTVRVFASGEEVGRWPIFVAERKTLGDIVGIEFSG